MASVDKGPLAIRTIPNTTETALSKRGMESE